MRFSSTVLAIACLISATSAAPAPRRSLMNLCMVDKSLEYLGPYAKPTIDLGASHGDNQLLQTTSATSFSIDTAGVGQATGSSFTIPPFSKANVTIALGVPALTSVQVKNLRDAWAAILDLTQRNSLIEYEQQDFSASRNLAFFGWFCGGKSAASSTSIQLNMESRGLTKDQIDRLIESFIEIASAMSTVQLEFTVFNQFNPFSVSGNIQLWVMSGVIKTSETQTQFRVISDGGIALGNQGNANAGGQIIPLTL